MHPDNLVQHLPSSNEIFHQVAQALLEDLGIEQHSLLGSPNSLSSDNSYKESQFALNTTLDITAQLIPKDNVMNAKIINREACVVSGIAWAQQAFMLCDSDLSITWHVKDGQTLSANNVFCEITGNAQAILTAERTALNFLQLLSATATTTAHYTKALAGTQTKLLDTRKTIPGLRLAQKYAVLCGGGVNHRIGLHDAYLIKENHIYACGGIKQAVQQAKKNAPNKAIEVEVESLDELEQAINAGVNTIMLDNFDTELIARAVVINQGKCKLEVSGNITFERLSELAATGVDYISSGALTKHIQAIDLSLISQD